MRHWGEQLLDCTPPRPFPCTSTRLPRGVACRSSLAGVVVAVALSGSVALADVIITDFNASPLGSMNPRENWFAFGVPTTDAGVQAGGSIGNGAFHSANWASATFGIGEIMQGVVDLSGFEAVRVDARSVDLGGHTGTPLLRFALDLPNATEWSTPAVPISSVYQTFTFAFTAMTRTTGTGPLDLTSGRPKLVLETNDQTGISRFDFDEVVGVTHVGGGPFELTPVVLRPPPDGDAVRAMWLYTFPNNLRVDDAAESQRILDFCAAEGINRIYFGAFDAWAGAATLRDNLRTFLTTAHSSGIRVAALISAIEVYQDPVLIRSSIDDILTFHAETPGNSLDNFDDMHYDIEFWISVGWTSVESERQNVARQFLDNVLVNARNHLDANGEPAMGVGTDLSAHFNIAGMLPNPFVYDGVTQLFNEHVMDHADELTFMSYIDSPGGLLNWVTHELDQAAGKGRRVLLAADIQPVPPEAPINSFADNMTPTPYSAMTTALEWLHTLLTPSQLQALEGFSVFHFDGYANQFPDPRNVADLDGDGDADWDDFADFRAMLAGPANAASGLAVDGDLNLDLVVDLGDFSLFGNCFTGPGISGPIAPECRR